MDEKTVCRLCLNLILSDNCENLEDMQKGMLAVIVPEFNLDLVCNPNVICNKCSKLLLDSYEFKSACIENSWKEKCESNEESLEEAGKLNNELPNTHKCSVCLNDIITELVDSPLLVMKLKKCLPELEICPESKVCDMCRPLLEMLFTFLTACLYAETKITGYMSLESADMTREINLYEIYDHYSFKIVTDEEVDNKDSHSPARDGDCVNSGPPFKNGEVGFGSNIKETKFPMEMDNCVLKESTRAASQNACKRISQIMKWEGEDIDRPVKNTKRDDVRSGTRNGTLKVPINSYKIIEIEGIPTFVCKLCTFNTKHKFSILRHFMVHKTAPDKPPQSDLAKCDTELPQGVVTMDQSMYTCKKCPFKTKFQQNLSLHSLTHKYTSRVKPLLTCSKCNFQTTYERSLKAHEKKGHHSV